jgi:NSS family neurotransmitter:Na+ symporter
MPRVWRLIQGGYAIVKERETFASRLGFVLISAGCAIGLGNVWRFPYIVGQYGGGAFLLCYLLIVFLVGFPVMLAELSIGRATQKNVVGAFRTLNPRWRFAGYIGIVTLFVILSYYCVVGGWVLKYVQIYAAGAHFGAGPGAYADYFSTFSARPVEPLLWGLGFLVLCIVVVVRGVSQGIEKVSKVLMPLLFLLLAGLVVYSVTRPGAGEGLRFLFGIDPARLSGDTLVGALGQAFFSLSVGMGIMVTYGSYVPKSENLAKSAGWICALDTLVAVMAALAIVPVVMITQGEEGLGMGGGFAFISLPCLPSCPAAAFSARPSSPCSSWPPSPAPSASWRAWWPFSPRNSTSPGPGRPSACRCPWRCSARATPSPSPPGGASTCPGSTSKTGCRCSP